MVDKITINEAYLNDRITQFTNYDAEAYARLHSFGWGGVTGNLSAPLRMGVGRTEFTPGADLLAAAESVRENFKTRMTQFKEQSQHLYSGLQGFLDNQEEVQSLNETSAAEFGGYVEQASSGLGSGGSSTPAA
ncbi:hypothetical protein [Kineosporia babensis]|uniref:Uncharacterized protein n=1 Tax=Kineosporia babensis TaxID=499548 RepID=A0A9X1NAU1_9ACTN|nr:hypothetical protein [Kineosporia babensis]MCD5310305.1 hypothetical protein [Kineosporia babensis]